MTEQEREFERRMAKKRAEREQEQAEAAERDRRAYLRRTGRTEMKP